MAGEGIVERVSTTNPRFAIAVWLKSDRVSADVLACPSTPFSLGHIKAICKAI